MCLNILKSIFEEKFDTNLNIDLNRDDDSGILRKKWVLYSSQLKSILMIKGLTKSKWAPTKIRFC
jgi:hypothetical protein